LINQANTDPLTQLPNRRYFFENLQQLLTLQNRNSQALLIMDIDNFKAINDTYTQAT